MSAAAHEPRLLVVSGRDLRLAIYAHFETRDVELRGRPIFLARCRACGRLFTLDRPGPEEEVSVAPLHRALDHLKTHEGERIMTPQKLEAAVALCMFQGQMLVVWNRRYRGWALPGGLIRPGETVNEAAKRELLEETGCKATKLDLYYTAPIFQVLAPQRGEHVTVCLVEAWEGMPSETEPGCPVTWMRPADFLASCPFAVFYAAMSERLKLGWVP